MSSAREKPAPVLPRCRDCLWFRDCQWEYGAQLDDPACGGFKHFECFGQIIMTDKPKHGEIKMQTEYDAENKCYRVKATLYFDPRRVIVASHATTR